MCKAKKNRSQSQAIEHLSNLVKALRSDKLGVQVELIQNFNKSKNLWNTELCDSSSFL